MIPKQLEIQVIYALCPCRETRTALSISQHVYWENLHKTVHKNCTKCKDYQFLQWDKKEYRELPPQEAETRPFDTLCLDLIGKYQFTLKGEGKKF